MGHYIHRPLWRPVNWNPAPYEMTIRGWTFVPELGGWRKD